jgi:hypothetical protein
VRALLTRLDGRREEPIDFLARLVNQDRGTDDRDDVNELGYPAILETIDVGADEIRPRL